MRKPDYRGLGLRVQEFMKVPSCTCVPVECPQEHEFKARVALRFCKGQMKSLGLRHKRGVLGVSATKPYSLGCKFADILNHETHTSSCSCGLCIPLPAPRAALFLPEPQGPLKPKTRKTQNPEEPQLVTPP